MIYTASDLRCYGHYVIYTPKTEGLPDSTVYSCINHTETDTPSDITDLYRSHVVSMILYICQIIGQNVTTMVQGPAMDQEIL